MTSAIDRMVEYANRAMSNNLHNYGGAGFLALTLLVGVVILVRWLWAGVDPGSGILDLFLYSGGLYCSTQGIAGGIHTYKAIRGKVGLNTPTALPAGEEG